MRLAIYLGLLALVVLIAWRRGRTDERLAALVCVVGTAMTALATPALGSRYSSFQIGIFLVDLFVLAAFLAIALRSDRFWPMWVAGLQLTGTAVHLLKLLQPDLMPFVVGAALAFWSYPILLLVGIGAWRTAMIQQWRDYQRLPDAG